MPARHSVKAYEAETALSVCRAEKGSGKKDMKKASVTGRRLFPLGWGFQNRGSVPVLCSFIMHLV